MGGSPERIRRATYTGRTIISEVHLAFTPERPGVRILQADFIKGRMDDLDISGHQQRADEDPCTIGEKAEFRSSVGNLHWVTAQTRPDFAVNTSRFQKKQNKPVWKDYKELAKTIREIKASAEVGIVIQPIDDPVLAVWTDSSLYGSEGEPLDQDIDVKMFDKHSLYSQGGALVGMISRKDLDSLPDVQVSFLDWRSRASKRVLHSTFAAESGSALESIGLGIYLRAYYLEVVQGKKLP